MTDDPAGQAGDGDAAAGGSEPATCYRHPDREAHIRCVRCNRRICPDCMIDASVGFQCPECVREGNKGVRRAQTVFGGRLSKDPGYVTKALIGINALAFLAQQVIGSEVEYRFALVGRNVDALGQGIGVSQGEPYRLLTATFLHANLLHLAMNMFLLFILGTQLEAELGRVRYAALYVISALGGSAASYAFNPPPNFALGASGAVFGLLGAFLIVNRRLRRDSSGLLVLLGINLVLGFSVRGIDWRAHLGGLIAGALCTVALVYAPPQRRSLVQGLGLGVVLLAVIAVVAWRTAALT